MNGAHSRRLLPALVYTALSSSVVSSLGMLLVPTVADEMDVTISTAQWMLTVNLLVGAIATPVLGRLSDGPNKKRLLIIALTMVFVGSMIAATAPTFTLFLLGRAAQGFSYAITPVTIAIAQRYVAENKVQSGISSLSVTVATGLGLGYPLTGLLAGLYDFRLAFWFAAAFAATAIIVAALVIPSGPDRQAVARQFDVLGSVFLAAGLGMLLLGISEGPAWSWTSPVTLGVILAAIAICGGWVLFELRREHPLVDLRVFRQADVLLANATAIALGAAMYIALSIVSLIAQAPVSTGYGAEMPLTWAGFVMLPLSVGSLFANRLVRWLSGRVSLTSVLPLGAGTLAVAMWFLTIAHREPWHLFVGLLFFGAGAGATFAAMPALIRKHVAAAELGSAVSFNQVLRTVGGSFGSAIAGAIVAANLAADKGPTPMGIEISLAVGAAISVSVLVALVGKRIWPGRPHA